MKFDFGLESKWVNENKRLHHRLKLNPLSSVRVYAGLSDGISEIVKGMVRLFPHRKSFGVVKGCGPFYDELVAYLSMEGLARIEIPVSDLRTPDKVIQAVPKDCLCLLGSLDDPMTGQIFPSEEWTSALHKNRTFTLLISHNLHLFKPLPEITQYGVVVLRFRQGAAALLGQRAAKVGRMNLGPQDWLEREWDFSFQTSVERKKEVTHFEANLPEGIVPFFSNDVARVYDRAVVRTLRCDGEAFIRILSKELGLTLATPGVESRLETLSLCRWQGLNTFDWYEYQNATDTGNVILIDQSLLSERCITAMRKTQEHLLKMQGP